VQNTILVEKASVSPSFSDNVEGAKRTIWENMLVGENNEEATASAEAVALECYYGRDEENHTLQITNT
jgi:hypothetical protein